MTSVSWFAAAVASPNRDAAIGELRQRAHRRAVRDRRVLAVGDRALRFLGGVHVRHADALRARIENARGVMVLLARHAHDRREPDGQARRRDLRRGVEIHGAVLHVDKDPVEAASLDDGRDVGGARQAQAHADRDFAFREPALCVIRKNIHDAPRLRPSAQNGAWRGGRRVFA